MRAQLNPALAIRTAGYDPATQTQLVGVKNTGPTTLSGPFWLVVTVGAKSAAQVVNKQGMTIYGTPKPYCLIRKTSLAPKQEAVFQVKYSGATGTGAPVNIHSNVR